LYISDLTCLSPIRRNSDVENSELREKKGDIAGEHSEGEPS